MSLAIKSTTRLPWLFSPWLDLFAFGGSFLMAAGLLVLGAALGILHGDATGWTWVSTILLIDVAHVYATGFRVYFDRNELRRRPWLYGLTPVLSFVMAAAVYSESVTLFWTCLAYLAVFHFVRQQYGWVSLYRSREEDRDPRGWWVDAGAIYLSTIYPLVHWHANLPTSFWWFSEGDFVALPTWTAIVLQPVYWLALAAYATRSLWRGFRHGRWNPGKDLVVSTTAFCWYAGIIWLASDYAFTVTNVIIHGVPYMVLIYWYRWHRHEQPGKALEISTKEFETRSTSPKRSTPIPPAAPANRSIANSGTSTSPTTKPTPKLLVRRVGAFIGVIWVLAYAEELLWDVGLWRQRQWLFGAWNVDLPAFAEWTLAPLLVVPQITHYILDGFLWRRRARSSDPN